MTPGEIAALMGTTIAQLAACRAVVESELSASLVDLPACTSCPRPDHVRALTPQEMLQLLEMTELQLSAFAALVREATTQTQAAAHCPGCAVKALGARVRDQLEQVKAAKRICRGSL